MCKAFSIKYKRKAPYFLERALFQISALLGRCTGLKQTWSELTVLKTNQGIETRWGGCKSLISIVLFNTLNGVSLYAVWWGKGAYYKFLFQQGVFLEGGHSLEEDGKWLLVGYVYWAIVPRRWHLITPSCRYKFHGFDFKINRLWGRECYSYLSSGLKSARFKQKTTHEQLQI